jgi:hypothetical protein
MLNLSILAVFGTFTALGEEIGWRGYLQPRLDAAGVRWSVAVVWLCQLAYHAPVIAGAGYANAGGLFTSLGLFAAGDLPTAFLWAHESYRARSLWPAVFFHSFHNTISQWLFPRLFAGGENELWLGEGGLLPVAGLRHRRSWDLPVDAATRVFMADTGGTYANASHQRPHGLSLCLSHADEHVDLLQWT